MLCSNYNTYQLFTILSDEICPQKLTLLTLQAPRATLVDKKFLPLSATGDFSQHEERLYIDVSNIDLFLL